MYTYTYMYVYIHDTPHYACLNVSTQMRHVTTWLRYADSS